MTSYHCTNGPSTIENAARLTMTFEVSAKNIESVPPVDGKSSGFVFHSTGTILEIDGSEVSDGEIEILLPLRSFPSISREYTGEIVEMLSERIDRGVKQVKRRSVKRTRVARGDERRS